MIIILKNGTPKPRVEDICELLKKKYGVDTHPIFGSESTIIGLVGDTSLIPVAEVEMIDDAERVLKVQEPYKRANRKFHPDDTIVEVGANRIGDKRVVVCAGPCAVESEEQILVIADAVKRIRAGGQERELPAGTLAPLDPCALVGPVTTDRLIGSVVETIREHLHQCRYDAAGNVRLSLVRAYPPSHEEEAWRNTAPTMSTTTSRTAVATITSMSEKPGAPCC